MGLIVKFILGNLWGQIASAAVVTGLLFSGWLMLHDSKVARQTTERIERHTDALATKARKAQSTVARDGAFERLRREYCPDCK